MAMKNKLYQMRSFPSGMVVCHFENLRKAKQVARQMHDSAAESRKIYGYRDKPKRHFEIYKLEKVFSTQRRK